MSETPKGQRLGRGLSALLGDADTSAMAVQHRDGGTVVPVEQIVRNADQPRQHFDEADLEGLSRSIAEKGILQPLIVRPVPGGDGYQIVAGERRWRAAQRAGLHEVPVVIRDLSDREVMEVALVENLQRSDLDPIEQAQGFATLAQRYNHTQEDIARVVGKSRAAIANALRLLGLPEAVKALIHEGALSAGHGRALAGSNDPETLAARIVRQGLNVRQTEQLTRQGAPETKSRTGAQTKNTDTLALEENLTRALGLTVAINTRAGGAGQVRISYKTLEQLDDICRRLSAN